MPTGLQVHIKLFIHGEPAQAENGPAFTFCMASRLLQIWQVVVAIRLLRAVQTMSVHFHDLLTVRGRVCAYHRGWMRHHLHFNKWRTLALGWVRLLRWDARGGMWFPIETLNVGVSLSESSCALAAQGPITFPGDLSLHLVPAVNLGHLHGTCTCSLRTCGRPRSFWDHSWKPNGTLRALDMVLNLSVNTSRPVMVMEAQVIQHAWRQHDFGARISSESCLDVPQEGIRAFHTQTKNWLGLVVQM